MRPQRRAGVKASVALYSVPCTRPMSSKSLECNASLENLQLEALITTAIPDVFTSKRISILLFWQTFFLYHIKQTPPETFAFTSRDSIKLSLSCLRSLSTLCYNLVHRDFVISSFHLTVNWSTSHWWNLVSGNSGIPDVLVRYKHARKLEIKHRKFGGAYNLSTFLEDPMGYSKQAISFNMKSQCAFPLKNRHNVNPWVAIKSDWLWRQYGSGLYYRMRHLEAHTYNGKTIVY